MFSLSGRRRGSKGRRGGTSPLGCSRHSDAKQKKKLQAYQLSIRNLELAAGINNGFPPRKRENDVDVSLAIIYHKKS